MSELSIKDLPLAGLKLVTRQRLGDDRGYLSRIFCIEELAPGGWIMPVSQVNHTFTGRRGTVRGLHFQRPPHAEMKYICCIRGRIWDVAVDIRAGSPSFLQWHAEYLSADQGTAMLIPEGFAHGFQALTDDVEVIYCHSTAFAPDAEAGLNSRDARLAIAWPDPITAMSARDANLPMLADSFPGIEL